jgi:glycine dehydrogenase
MLASIGFSSMDALIQSTVPANILTDKPLNLQPPMSESEALTNIKKYASKNKVMKSYIGAGYYDTQTPPVIQDGTRPTLHTKPKFRKDVWKCS